MLLFNANTVGLLQIKKYRYCVEKIKFYPDNPVNLRPILLQPD